MKILKINGDTEVYVNFYELKEYLPDKLLPIIFKQVGGYFTTYASEITKNKEYGYDFDYNWSSCWVDYRGPIYIKNTIGKKLLLYTILLNYIKNETN